MPGASSIEGRSVPALSRRGCSATMIVDGDTSSLQEEAENQEGRPACLLSLGSTHIPKSVAPVIYGPTNVHVSLL